MEIVKEIYMSPVSTLYLVKDKDGNEYIKKIKGLDSYRTSLYEINYYKILESPYIVKLINVEYEENNIIHFKDFYQD